MQINSKIISSSLPRVENMQKSTYTRSAPSQAC